MEFCTGRGEKVWEEILDVCGGDDVLRGLVEFEGGIKDHVGEFVL